MKINNHIVLIMTGVLLTVSINAFSYDSLTIVNSYPTPTTGPRGLTYDGTYLYWAQAYNHLTSKTDLIYKVDPSTGATVETYDWTLSSFPNGMAWDGTNFYVSDDTADKIFVVDENFNYVREFDSPETYMRDLTYDGTNLLAVSDSTDKIWTLNPKDGSVVNVFSTPHNEPSGIAWDGSHIWLSQGAPSFMRVESWIYKLDANGAIIEQYQSPGGYPTGLTFDGQNLWCVDWETDTVYQLVPEPATFALLGFGRLVLRRKNNRT